MNLREKAPVRGTHSPDTESSVTFERGDELPNRCFCTCQSGCVAWRPCARRINSPPTKSRHAAPNDRCSAVAASAGLPRVRIRQTGLLHESMTKKKGRPWASLSLKLSASAHLNGGLQDSAFGGHGLGVGLVVALRLDELHQLRGQVDVRLLQCACLHGAKGAGLGRTLHRHA